MTYAANVDGNQGEIVDGLRDLGWSVELIHRVGKGVPDLLVGAYGLNVLVEVKDPARKDKHGRFERAHNGLNEAEAKWHEGWKGQVEVSWTLDQAVELVDAHARAMGRACAHCKGQRGFVTHHVAGCYYA